MRRFAKFTRPFMKQIERISEKDYSYHVSVIEYTLYAGKGRAAVKTTSEISKIVGVSKRTLQFYDDEGVIQAKRSENNYRLYDEGTLKDLWEIMLYKEMGLRLKEIKKILRVPEEEKKEILQKCIYKIEDKIQELKERKKFISFILTKGLPLMPEESMGISHKSRIAEIRKEVCKCKENPQQFVGGEKIPNRSYLAANIKELRYLLDEAYQQMQQGQFRYAVYDADIVMRESVKIILQCRNGYVSEDLLVNIKSCERRGLLGNDKEFIRKLYEVYHICNSCHGNKYEEKYLNYSKVHFAIMQLADLLNYVEREMICP